MQEPTKPASQHELDEAYEAGVAAGAATERARIVVELRRRSDLLRADAIARGFVSDEGLGLASAADFIDEAVQS